MILWHKVCLYLLATKPFSAIHNPKEISNALVDCLGCKKMPLLFLVFRLMVDPSADLILSALRCNHSSSTIFIVARTAAIHSYRNPPEKVNPLLNLDLYCFECMQKEVTVDQYFEKSLDNLNITEQVPSLLKKKTCGTHLLKESCQPCIDLMRDVFFLFSLKGNPIQVKSVILDS